MKTISKILSALVFITICVGISHADPRYQRGPFTAAEAQAAPEWTVSKWIKGPKTSLSDLKGQVVVIDFFQLWCPGCNKFSIPLMGYWEQVFDKEIKAEKINLISIHTVFEGHDYQNDERLAEFVKEKGMNHAVAVDLLPKGSRLPQTMMDFKTRGTPEMAIIDKNGKIRFQGFGSFDYKWATGFIEELLEESAEG